MMPHVFSSVRNTLNLLVIEPWTSLEKQQLREFFADSWGKIPRKEDIIRFKQVSGSNRDWKRIKSCVRHMMDKDKK